MREFTYMLHGTSLEECVAQAIGAAGGWIGFDRFMALALYTPGLGYYAGDLPKFGALPGSGSDFVTAPEMTPLFGQTLAVQVAEALQRTGTREVWEFGAGSGALASACSRMRSTLASSSVEVAKLARKLPSLTPSSPSSSEPDVPPSSVNMSCDESTSVRRVYDECTTRVR